MLQRIQSIYMFLSVVCSVVCLANPVGRFLTDMGETTTLYNLWLSEPHLESSSSFLHRWTPWVALFALLTVVSALTLLGIFLYKNRILQMRILSFCMIVLVGYYLAGGLFVWQNGGTFRPEFCACLPLISLIADYLAFRSIHKDELLIKSLDRLR